LTFDRDPVEGRSGTPLSGVDTVLTDLDGVVYRGAEAIPHAAESLQRVDELCRLAYLTNNASRSPETVAEHLRGMGAPATPETVVTSVHVAMTMLRQVAAPPDPVLVIGGDGLTRAVAAAGYSVVAEASSRPVAVVQGFDASLGWRHLAEAAFALSDRSIPWIATYSDPGLPVAGGIAPGNGALVGAVAAVVERQPEVAGKPHRAMFDEAIRRTQAANPLFIGDRLDTDISGARAAGIRSALVLTGVTRLDDLLEVDPSWAPDFVIDDLRGLFEPYPLASIEPDGTVTVGSAAVRNDGGTIEIVRDGDPLDLVRARIAALLPN
jgi:HAD superfamily hydrolase (TIGR01450 family)